jgi:hypothetical protein
MTIPAMAPPESLEPDSGDEEEDAPVDFGVEDGFVDADVGDPVAAAFAFARDVAIVELPVAEPAMLDCVPARTCASRTTPAPDVQQLSESLQHQSSLIVVPLQGVIVEMS